MKVVLPHIHAPRNQVPYQVFATIWSCSPALVSRKRYTYSNLNSVAISPTAMRSTKTPAIRGAAGRRCQQYSFLGRFGVLTEGSLRVEFEVLIFLTPPMHTVFGYQVHVSAYSGAFLSSERSDALYRSCYNCLRLQRLGMLRKD